jgi:putative ABC transport system permease protein
VIDWRDTLSVSVDALRRNKLRTVLTSLGMIIGSMSIVMIVTVALTSRNFAVSQIEAAGSNLAWAELVNAGTKGQPLNHELNVADLEAVRTSVPGLVEVSGTRGLSTTVVIGGRTRAVKLIGVTQGYRTIRRLIIARGRFFDSTDMETRSKVCLVTEQLSDRLFGLENPVGRIIRVGELTFTVIGVFRERLPTFGLGN